MSKLSVVKIKEFSIPEIELAVEKALDSIECDKIINAKTILIKPNLCYYWDYSTGETTDPRVVSSIIDWVRKKGDKDIKIFVVEADASAMKTKYAFKMLGYDKLCMEKKVDLINLSEGDIIKEDAVVNGEKLSLPVNRLLLDSDLIINVPTLKTHRTVGFTCALKNMFGAISKPRKYSYHKKLPETIVAINKIVRSDIIIVDGIIASGKHPKKLGIIIAGKDATAIDKYVSKLIGFKNSQIRYLTLAIKENLGDQKRPKIVADSDDILYIKKEFPKPNFFVEGRLWNFLLSMLRLYVRIVGDVLPPVLEID